MLQSKAMILTRLTKAIALLLKGDLMPTIAWTAKLGQLGSWSSLLPTGALYFLNQ
jgi:hypothetical protein